MIIMTKMLIGTEIRKIDETIQITLYLRPEICLT
jgi:hypothetical protein